MVAGEVVYEQGRLATMDEAALRAEARELFSRRAPALEQAAQAAERWLPHYRAMYARACARDIGMNRWLGDAERHHQDI
jgi:5-methylthioadenosine/S-adenosylhomocysteine deaminase